MADDSLVRDLEELIVFCNARGWGGAAAVFRKVIERISSQKSKIAVLEEELHEASGWRDPFTIDDLTMIYDQYGDHKWPFSTAPYLFMVENRAYGLTGSYWLAWSYIIDILENKSPLYRKENYGAIWMLFIREPTREQITAMNWSKG